MALIPGSIRPCYPRMPLCDAGNRIGIPAPDRFVTACYLCGSSGNLRRQIAQGAPFQLFISADESYVTALVKQNLTLGSGQVYALGRIAAILPKGSDIQLRQDLSGLRSAIEDGRLDHFAIANPDHAPYGRAAREALQTLGLWQAIRPFLSC